MKLVIKGVLLLVLVCLINTRAKSHHKKKGPVLTAAAAVKVNPISTAAAVKVNPTPIAAHVDAFPTNFNGDNKKIAMATQNQLTSHHASTFMVSCMDFRLIDDMVRAMDGMG